MALEFTWLKCNSSLFVRTIFSEEKEGCNLWRLLSVCNLLLLLRVLLSLTFSSPWHYIRSPYNHHHQAFSAFGRFMTTLQVLKLFVPCIQLHFSFIKATKCTYDIQNFTDFHYCYTFRHITLLSSGSVYKLAYELSDDGKVIRRNM